MKQRNFFAVFLCAGFAAAGLAGCAGKDAGELPAIDGAHDIDCLTNTTVDLLEGVAALDREDGDITPAMHIAVTGQAGEVPVENGYASFPAAGDYEVVYTVTDSAGNTAREEVVASAVAREVYFDGTAVGGFSASAAGGAKLTQSGSYGGKYLLSAAGAEAAEDVRIARTYTLSEHYEYTFEYEYDSTAAGLACVTAGGEQIAELPVIKGKGSLSFVWKPAAGTGELQTEIALLLGGLEGENGAFTFELVRAKLTREQKEDIDLTAGFSFSGKVKARFDEGTAGTAAAFPEGDGATLTVTGAVADKRWAGGMFIDTGFSMRAGTEYTVSFTVQGTGAGYTVSLQNNQFNEKKFADVTFSGADAHTEEHTFTATSEDAGPLWLYVQSGDAQNTITLSSLKVIACAGAGGVTEEDMLLSDKVLRQQSDAGFEGAFEANGNGFKVTFPRFSESDGAQQVRSPDFYLSGSGENYAITFAASASVPTEIIFVAPTAGGWDPTLTWNRFTIGEKKQYYTFYCGSASGSFALVWQFGSANNTENTDVTIEVTDIAVCLKDGTLDD